MNDIDSIKNTMDDVTGAGAAVAYPLPGTGAVSPITMYQDWSPNERLVGFTLCAVTNIFFSGLYMSAFFVATSLYKAGNAFLCCLGLMDMIKGGVLPIISVVVILSHEGDDSDTCYNLQFLIYFSNYGYNLLYMFVAAENYYIIAWAPRGYNLFNKKQVTIAIIFIMLVSAITSAIGTYLELDYDFCLREHFGNMEFRFVTFVFLFAIPLALTSFYLGYGIIRLHTRNSEPQYRRSQKHRDEMSQIKTNTFIYAINICSWAPMLISMYHYPDTTPKEKMYIYMWIGLSRSVYVPVFYSVCNSTFRTAYIESFCYCCCRGSFPARGQLNNRQRRSTEYRSPSGDLRVHVLQKPKMHPGSPQRATLSIREGQEL